MVRIELTSEQAEALRQVVESDISNLRMEIADTEDQAFREELKEREEFLKALLRQLGGQAAGAR
jgi:hypothetical protein